MSTKQLNQLAGWCAFGMAACLVVNGIVTFVEPFWLWEPSRLLTVLFGLGVLPAIHLKVAPVNKPLAWLVTLWGYLGFGAEAIRVLGLAEVMNVRGVVDGEPGVLTIRSAGVCRAGSNSAAPPSDGMGEASALRAAR